MSSLVVRGLAKADNTNATIMSRRKFAAEGIDEAG
jgi:hypothetical protein